MSGALALRAGVLYVGWHARALHVRAFELGGRPLSRALELRDPEFPATHCAGLDVDGDHRLWIADSAAARVRCLNVFGAQLASVAERAGMREDQLGSMRLPLGLACDERDGRLRLWVAQGGVRRTAVQQLDEHGQVHGRLRSLGDPRESFRGARRVRVLGRRLFVVETIAARVLVFRDGEFHFAYRAPRAAAAESTPSAIAPLADGSCVLALRGEASALVHVDAGGHVLRVLARAGAGSGEVQDPSDVAAELGEGSGARIAVVDRDGLRVQVFDLRGALCGAIEDLAG